MNTYQQKMLDAKNAYTKCVMETLQELRSEGYWRVSVAFGRYENMYREVFFAPNLDIVKKICADNEQEYKKKRDKYAEAIVEVHFGPLEWEALDAINEMFDSRTIRY
jgi:hypothetical protein